MSTENLTALCGTLIRWAENTWAWSDHTPAQEIKDARPSWYYNFRVASGMVEVPEQVAKQESELAWVRDYPMGLNGDHGSTQMIHRDGRQTRHSESGKAIPRVYLVPVEEWDQWDSETVIGPRWDRKNEEAILSKARQLGWKN